MDEQTSDLSWGCKMSRTLLRFFGISPSVDNITFLDYPEPTGHAVTVFFTGCGFRCKNCQNQRLRERGKVEDCLFFDEFVDRLEEVLHRARTNKVVLMGGDPIDIQNREFTYELIQNLKDSIDFCVYTGHDISFAKRWVKGARYIKSGTYEEDLKQKSEKTETYMQFASSNQSLYRLTEDGIYEDISKDGRIEF